MRAQVQSTALAMFNIGGAMDVNNGSMHSAGQGRTAHVAQRAVSARLADLCLDRCGYRDHVLNKGCGCYHSTETDWIPDRGWTWSTAKI